MYTLRSIVDVMIYHIAPLPPIPRAVAKFFAYPFILWRMYDVKNILVREYAWLRPVFWSSVVKHGEHVVWGDYGGYNGLLNEQDGTVVVDYKNKTIRVVLNVPDEYRDVGATF